MKKIILTILTFSIIISCNQKSETEKSVGEIPVVIKVSRFDQFFYKTNPNNLGQLKAKFPYFFPTNIPDSIYINKIKNPLWRELYAEVQKKFNDISTIQTEIENVVKHIKFYYPQTKDPKIVTLITEMDYTTKCIYADSLILIPLELYMGKNHKFYANEFPDYIKQNFEPSQIAPDVVENFATQKIVIPKEKTLLSQMIYAGKILYLKDKLLPNLSDELKIGYTKEQLLFCQENESQMWSNFIENQYLFSSDSKLQGRFINPAPFSKFYLEIDNDTPGRVGAWLGWQIVQSYAENNEIKLQDLLKLNSKVLFDNSRYKPKK